MKYYDKYLSKINTNIKNILLVLIVFCVGFFAGYIVGGQEAKDDQDSKVNSIVIDK